MALAQCSALAIKHAKTGVLYDGGGLEFDVKETGVCAVFRYTSPAGKRRSKGLGPLDRASTQAVGCGLVNARRQVQEARALLARGLDPIEERKSKRLAAIVAVAAKKKAATLQRTTLARLAREYHKRVIEPTRTSKHSAQWHSGSERGPLVAADYARSRSSVTPLFSAQ